MVLDDLRRRITHKRLRGKLARDLIDFRVHLDHLAFEPLPLGRGIDNAFQGKEYHANFGRASRSAGWLRIDRFDEEAFSSAPRAANSVFTQSSRACTSQRRRLLEGML